MTEPRLRDLLSWLDAHRSYLGEHAGALAELALWIRGGSVLDRERAAVRAERIAFELAAALEALEHVMPRDPFGDEDTVPIAMDWSAEPPRIEPSPYREERKKRPR